MPARVASCGVALRGMRKTTMLRVAGWKATPPGAGAARTALPAEQSLVATVDFLLSRGDSTTRPALLQMEMIHGV